MKSDYWVKKLLEARKDEDFEKVARLVVRGVFFEGKKQAFLEISEAKKRMKK